jgi:hypothetical protein
MCVVLSTDYMRCRVVYWLYEVSCSLLILLSVMVSTDCIKCRVDFCLYKIWYCLPLYEVSSCYLFLLGVLCTECMGDVLFTDCMIYGVVYWLCSWHVVLSPESFWCYVVYWLCEVLCTGCLRYCVVYWLYEVLCCLLIVWGVVVCTNCLRYRVFCWLCEVLCCLLIVWSIVLFTDCMRWCIVY